jgi:SLOG cluster3 family
VAPEAGVLMNPVLVSASVPDPKRNPVYFQTADNVAIRDAITALVQVVTPRAKLVFGGHPAITPMVAGIAKAMGTLENVVIFQSAEFEPMFPLENSAFKSLFVTPKLANRKLSLQMMRDEMINFQPFEAAFFIGGMEGVEEEFAAVRALRPTPLCFPIASTGAAALRLAQKYGSEVEPPLRPALFHNLNYFGLFRRLLRVADDNGGLHGRG